MAERALRPYRAVDGIGPIRRILPLPELGEPRGPEPGEIFARVVG
jgi:hypothetical protein